MKTKTRLLKICAVLLVAFLLLPDPGFAFGIRQSDTNRFAAGVQRLLFAPFQLPFRMLSGTINGPFLFGTLGGTFNGIFYTIGDLAGGAFDMAAASAPYAKYAVFAI